LKPTAQNPGVKIGRIIAIFRVIEYPSVRLGPMCRHDEVGAVVAVGTYDAGALKEGTFNKLVEKGTH